MGRKRLQFGLDLRTLVVGDHLVFYRIEPEKILILRVLDGRMDVEAELLR